MQNHSDVVNQMIETLRQQSGRTAPFSSHYLEVKRELRMRRKLFLGSHVPLAELFFSSDTIEEKAVYDFSKYVADKSLLFWVDEDPDAEDFFFRFYQLTIYALCGSRGADSCVDDIILAAESLSLSMEAFIDYMKAFLPRDLLGELFDFTDTYKDNFSSARFVDSILGAVCILMGVIPEPVAFKSAEVSKEVISRVRSKKSRTNHPAG